MTNQKANGESDSKPILPLTCIFGCSDSVVVVVYTPDGCLCAGNKYQPRCAQHLMRLHDTNSGEYEIVEDFRIYDQPKSHA